VRVPPFERYAGWLSAFGLIVAGMVIGSAVFMSIYQNNMSILLQRNGALKNQVEKLKDSEKNFEKFRNKQQYIGKVDVIVEVNRNDMDKTDVNVLNEIKSQVYKDISKHLSGKLITAVRDNPEVYIDMVEQKVYRNIFDKNYIVTVKRLMVFQTELLLYISYREYHLN